MTDGHRYRCHRCLEPGRLCGAGCGTTGSNHGNFEGTPPERAGELLITFNDLEHDRKISLFLSQKRSDNEEKLRLMAVDAVSFIMELKRYLADNVDHIPQAMKGHIDRIST